MTVSRRHFALGCLAYYGISRALSIASAKEVQDSSGFMCTTQQLVPNGSQVALNPLVGKGDPRVQLDPNGNNGATVFTPYQLLMRSQAWRIDDSILDNRNTIGVAVHYLDGDNFQRRAVEQYASEWSVSRGASNVRFIFGSSETSHIRILFNTSENRSAVGREAKISYTDYTKPTMFLGDVRKDASANRIAQVIRHEFGHALGMLHEHQHPLGGIHWNKSRVIADYKAAGWTKADVKQFVFKLYTDETYMCTGAPNFDPQSIMMYPIRTGWASNIVVQDNFVIRDADLACVHSAYG